MLFDSFMSYYGINGKKQGYLFGYPCFKYVYVDEIILSSQSFP